MPAESARFSRRLSRRDWWFIVLIVVATLVVTGASIAFSDGCAGRSAEKGCFSLRRREVRRHHGRVPRRPLRNGSRRAVCRNAPVGRSRDRREVAMRSGSGASRRRSYSSGGRPSAARTIRSCSRACRSRSPRTGSHATGGSRPVTSTPPGSPPRGGGAASARRPCCAAPPAPRRPRRAGVAGEQLGEPRSWERVELLDARDRDVVGAPRARAWPARS